MKLKELEAIAAPTKPEKQQTESIWNKDIQLFGSKLTDKDKSNFYQQLYTLITAGVDISTSLQHIVKQAGKKQVTKIVNEILDNIMKGSSLSSALQETGAFTNYEVYSIQIGEESGELAEVLQNLFDYLEEKIGQRREIISALSYPILIITSAIGAVLFMIFFIIPVFEEIFMRFGGELPGLTQQVIDFSVWLRTNAWSAIISILVIVLVFRFSRRYEQFNFVLEKIVLRIPLIGPLYRETMLSKFCNSMGLLLNANVPLVRALELNANMYQNIHLLRSIHQLKDQLIKGMSFSDALEKESLYDLNFKILLKVGEESSKLGFFFRKLSMDYRQSLKHKTGMLNTALEPALIIILGLFVGVILISMYLPMFELSTQMSAPG